MKTEYLIGIDVGTTSVKAGLFTVDGVLVERTATGYPTHHPAPTYVEQNPADWTDAILAALRSFVPIVGGGVVRSIGITSQVNTHVFCDQNMDVLHSAIVWKDGRAASEANNLDRQISDEQRMQWWGAPMPVDASHVLSRMKWMQHTHPALWEKTRHVLLPKDYCIWQLTGQLGSDPWSNIGVVNNELSYAAPLLSLVDNAESLLPPIRTMTDIAGQVKTGLPFGGVPVAIGTMDAWAGVFGTDVSSQGECMYLSGTSEVLGIVSETVNPTPGVLVMPRSHDITMHIGPTQSGGASQLWFCGLFGIEPQQMADLAGQCESTQSIPLFLPHIQGERAPIWDSAARGVFIGLSDSTDQSAMARAVYEGVAYSARWLLESLQQSSGEQPDRINVGGGGFQSDVWNQIRADILGVELNRVAVTDPGVLGAAGIGAVAAGVHGSVQEAFENLVKTDRCYEPDLSLKAGIDERMELFKDTYHSTAELSHRWLEQQ
jgi:xylulokinase